MKALFFALLITSPHIKAATELNMKPGLWSIEMLVKGPGGELTNPMKAIQKALANMPEEKRKEMMAAMQKMSPGTMSAEDMKVCYSQKMIQDPSKLAEHDKGNCKSTVVSQTAITVETKFSCKDGANGTAKWLMNDPQTYTGTVVVNKPDHPGTELTYKGKFLSKDCGKVKPLD